MSNFAEQEPHFRLLVCRTCSTIEELPGADEDPGDVLLTIAAERHSDTHYGVLWNVPKGIWMAPKMKEAVIQQIHVKVGSGLDSFGTKFYETKSQFSEDAMSCYSLHNRPKGQCPDYKSEKKWLSPKTQQERRAAGLPIEAKGPKIYLCDFCPVKTFNQKKAFETAKLYD
jgi:hypothetical protein